MSVTKIFVFDLDGTLCNCDHRLHYIKNKPKRWDLFFAGIPLDPPCEDVVWLAQTFKTLGHTIVLAVYWSSVIDQRINGNLVEQTLNFI